MFVPPPTTTTTTTSSSASSSAMTDAMTDDSGVSTASTNNNIHNSNINNNITTSSSRVRCIVVGGTKFFYGEDYLRTALGEIPQPDESLVFGACGPCDKLANKKARPISDDERMSLTTAISDEEDLDSAHNSPYHQHHRASGGGGGGGGGSGGGGGGSGRSSRAGVAKAASSSTAASAASFNCTGAVRKAGFLSVKKWLLRKKHQVELARKRGWKGYWVCLKGTTLLFYPCDSREGRSVEQAPRHLIIVDGAILQPIPEHPKRDYIFCLSTAFGDAYLFQAPCQVELENWVNSIHGACAAAFARHRGKTGTLHLLQEEILRLEKSIESDLKLKHMAELQLSVVSEADSKQQIGDQISKWEENLERLRTEQFRLKCYMTSLQGNELPNPKGLLTYVSRNTKATLNRLGVFTVSSLHAYICARSPSLLSNLLAGRGATKRRPPNALSRSDSASSRKSMQMAAASASDSGKAYTVSMPEDQAVTVHLRDGMTVEEFIVSACTKKGLSPQEHFLRVKKRKTMEDHNFFVPHRSDQIENYLLSHEVVEICGKILYQVDLGRGSRDQMWGFSVEAELAENSEKQDELCCYVSRVEDGSVAMQSGLMKGDEIMVINGAIVSDLDMMHIESVLQEETGLCLMMRSARTSPPVTGLLRSTDDIMSLVCPPPPSDNSIPDEMISNMIVPAPTYKELAGMGCPPPPPPPVRADLSGRPQRTSSFEIDNLLKTAEQITGYCRTSPADMNSKLSPTGSVSSSAFGSFHHHVSTPTSASSIRQMSDSERIRKVLVELIETERAYVRNLNNLLSNYLEPLKSETFLSTAEINALFGNITEIVSFQRMFLRSLEEAANIDGDFTKFEEPHQFKNALFALGNAFLFHAKNFKLYSSFCASHSKAQKVLHPSDGNQALQRFLAARNTKQQHSSSLESYLIKPIQRILKYPLILHQLRSLVDPDSEEHQHLGDALGEMEGVAEHINEMQRIHEEYGAIFDHLCRQYSKHPNKSTQPVDLSPGELLYYGGVEWLNIADFLGKVKKGLELHAMCFVFKSAVVFLCKERLKQRKKIMGGASGKPGGSGSEVEIIRYQVLVPVNEVQVRSSSLKDQSSQFLWELIHLRSSANSGAGQSQANQKRSSSPAVSPRTPGAEASRSDEEPLGMDDDNEDNYDDENGKADPKQQKKKKSAMLGRTPNHLSLSSTSTISGSGSSAGATASASGLGVQQQQQSLPCSPVWKPRDGAEAFPMPPAGSQQHLQPTTSSPYLSPNPSTPASVSPATGSPSKQPAGKGPKPAPPPQKPSLRKSYRNEVVVHINPGVVEFDV
ncbi:unnamed protein product [Notodromas monacha]|uniref:Still life n=1 Tax=Notodromas monacha TaxID=399045 RepID=A0A7R9BN93_9CRUS|nr:unnamed protein product [Notodromas monacha]CAG0918612.1 unnamed protein product [Notodromas monacha]